MVVPVQATPDLLRRLIDVLVGAPDGLTVIASILRARPTPDLPETWQGRLPQAWHGRLVASLRLAHAGPVADDPEILELLRSIGPSVEDAVGRKPYPTLFPPPDGARLATAVRSLFIDDLEGPKGEIIERRLAEATTPNAWIQMRFLGGATGRVGNDATAFGHRHARAAATLIAPFEDRAETAHHEEWVGAFEAELQGAGGMSGAYVGFLGTTGDEALHAAYPPATLTRLTNVKRRYDPGNVFRSNLNVRPDPGGASG